jgi:hypothetical protein
MFKYLQSVRNRYVDIEFLWFADKINLKVEMKVESDYLWFPCIIQENTMVVALENW